MSSRTTCTPLALVALALLSSPAWSLQGSDAEPTKGVFVLRILEQEGGRETFELRPDGWKAQGAFDLFGQRKGAYEIVKTRAEGKTTVSATLKDGDKEIPILGTFTAARFESRVQEKEAKTLDFEGKPAPIPFQNLVWSYWIDAGQELARRVVGGSLKAGDDLDFVELASATP